MRAFVVIILVLVGALVGIGVVASRMAVPAELEDPQLVKIDLPQGLSYAGASGRHLDISPDGSKVVYVARAGEESRSLYLQTIGDAAPAKVAGSEEASDPTFSRDGGAIAFYADESIKKVDIKTGAITRLGSISPAPRGILWLEDGRLVLGNTVGQLLAMSLSNGEVSPLFPLTGPELPHLLPSALPGNKAILFSFANGPLVNARLGAVVLATGEEKQLLDTNAFGPRYVPSGHLVFATGYEHRLMATRFDPEKLEISGTPVQIYQAGIFGTGNATDYSFSDTGVLAFTPGFDPTIDDVLAHFANVNLLRIHIQKDWLSQLSRLVP